MAAYIEIQPSEVRRRIWQIIPGLMSWGSLVGLTLLAFILPFWIAIFVIAYDVYILMRAVYMSIHLVYAYRRLNHMKDINWLDRCRKVSKDLQGYAKSIAEQVANNQTGTFGTQWVLKQHHHEVRKAAAENRDVYDWEKVHHVILLPTYDESLVVLRHSLNSITATDFPKDRMHIVVGFEERAGDAAKTRAEKLTEEFGDQFATFLTTFHPDGLPGEKKVKSANASWAMKEMEKELHKKGIEDDQVLISNFDSDTVVNPNYFSYLTFVFITHPDRYHASYQPIPLYNNNLWDAPAFSRVIAYGSTFWQLIESTRPERLVTFSSHSMTLKALKDVGYWAKDVVSEDSRIFWQCLLHYKGRYKTEPLYTTVSMDAALAPTWFKTLKNQYKQKRRWAWGIENFPYLAEGFLKDKDISGFTKFIYVFRTLEGHYSWATAPIIIAGLGWLPIFFGGPEFHTTVLSYSLPFMARTLMSIAMLGLLISASISLLLLPPRPEHYSRSRYIAIILQWVLVPIIATVLSAFPALDAETRLMLGRDLHFNVMQKSRKGDNEDA